MNWALRKSVPTLTWPLVDSDTYRSPAAASLPLVRVGCQALLIVRCKYNTNAMHIYCRAKPPNLVALEDWQTPAKLQWKRIQQSSTNHPSRRISWQFTSEGGKLNKKRQVLQKRAVWIARQSEALGETGEKPWNTSAKLILFCDPVGNVKCEMKNAILCSYIKLEENNNK